MKQVRGSRIDQLQIISQAHIKRTKRNSIYVYSSSNHKTEILLLFAAFNRFVYLMELVLRYTVHTNKESGIKYITGYQFAIFIFLVIFFSFSHFALFIILCTFSRIPPSHIHIIIVFVCTVHRAKC